MNLKIKNNPKAEILCLLNKNVHKWHVTKFQDIFKNDSADDILHYFKNSINNPNYYHFIAFDGNKPIGFIQTEIREHKGSAFRHPQKLIYIHIIVIIPEYRKKGIGRKLIMKVFDLAKDNNVSRIELDYWEGNDAVASFRKFNFNSYRHYMAINLNPDTQKL